MAAVLQAACGNSPGQSVENGFVFYEPKTQALFIQELKKEGIPYHVRDDGTVLYDARYEGKVSKIRLAVLNDSYVPAYHFNDERMEKEFMSQLRSQGIAFGVELRQGERFITWSERDSARVDAIRQRVLQSRQ